MAFFDCDFLGGRRNQESAQYSNLTNAVDDCWILEKYTQSLLLATANGSKTMEALLTEANTALNAVTIPSGYAYELEQLVLPFDSTSAQVALEVIGSGLTTSLSGLRAYRVMNSGNYIITYSVNTSGPSYSSITTNITNSTISTLDRLSIKPANGTTLYLRYNLWKKL